MLLSKKHFILILFSIAQIIICDGYIDIDDFDQRPISQFLSLDNRTITIITGAQSFIYDQYSPIMKHSKYHKSPYLTTNPSIIIRRYNDSNTYAIGCNSIGLSLLSDQAKQLAQYSFQDFDKNIQCTLLPYNPSKILLGYHLNGMYYINFFKYHEDSKTPLLTKESFDLSFSSRKLSPYISCELLDEVNEVFCVYNNEEGIKGVHFNILLPLPIPIHMIIDENNRNYPKKLVKIDDKNNVMLFIMNPYYVQVYGFFYNNYYSKVTRYMDKKIHQIDPIAPSFTMFDAKKIYTIEKSGLRISIIIVIGCHDAHCFLSKYTSNLDVVKPMITFPLYPSSSNHVGVSMTLYNQFEVLVILSEGTRNYMMRQSLNKCFVATDIYHHTAGIFSFDSQSSESMYLDIVIKYTSHGLIEHLGLKSIPGKISENKRYSLEQVKFSPLHSGNFTMKYLLYNDHSLDSETLCQIKIYVCYNGCDTCSQYGTSTDMKCTSCKEGYFSNKDNPTQCLQYINNTCQSISPYWIESKKICVDSCIPYDLYVDEDNLLCISQCIGEKKLDKIGKKCLSNEEYHQTMDLYISQLNDYIIDLYATSPKYQREEYTMTIYNTSVIPKSFSFDSILPNDNFHNQTYTSLLYLQECETLLKKKYQIDPREPLLIGQLDYVSSKQLSNRVNFSVYSLDGMINMDISSLCRDTEIIIASPIVNITGDLVSFAKRLFDKGINIFNSSDPFFHDICYSYTSESLTDIPLHLRIDMLLIDEAILCNPGCHYISFDFSKMFIMCSCSNNITESYQEKYEALKSEVTSFGIRSNLHALKCTHLVFNHKLFSCNLGSFLIAILSIMELLNMLYFFIKRMENIEKYMTSLIPTKKKAQKVSDKRHQFRSFNSNKVVGNGNGIENKNDSLEQEIGFPLNNHNNKPAINAGNDNSNVLLVKNKGKQLNLIDRIHSSNKNVNVLTVYKFSNENENHLTNGSNHNQNDNNSHNLQRYQNQNPTPPLYQRKVQRVQGMTKTFKETDNSLSYDNPFNNNHIEEPKSMINQNPMFKSIEQKATNIDSILNYRNTRNSQVTDINTTNNPSHSPHYYTEEQLMMIPTKDILFTWKNFIMYYCSFFRITQPIIRTFFISYKLTFNTHILQIASFIFHLVMLLSLNALFFSSSYISQAYYNKGTIDYIYNLPKVFYSFGVDLLFKIFFNYLSSTMNTLLVIKNDKRNCEPFDKRIQMIYQMKFRLKLFYVLVMVLIGFSWYYVSAFCAVYPNIQFTWLLCSVGSIIFEQVFSLFIAGLMTVMMLINSKWQKKCMMWFISFVGMMT